MLLSPNTNTPGDLHPFKALRMTTCPFLVGSFGSSVWTAKLLAEACRENPKRMEAFYVINVPRVKRHYQHLGKDGKLLVIWVPCFSPGGWKDSNSMSLKWYRTDIWTTKMFHVFCRATAGAGFYLRLWTCKRWPWWNSQGRSIPPWQIVPPCPPCLGSRMWSLKEPWTLLCCVRSSFCVVGPWSQKWPFNNFQRKWCCCMLLMCVFFFLRPYACQPGDDHFCDSETLSVVSHGELLFFSWPFPHHFALFVSCFSQVFLCSLIYCPPFALSIQHIGQVGGFVAAKAKNLMFQVEQTTLVQACQIDVHLLRTSDAFV